MLGRIDAWSASIQVQGESGGIGAVCRHPLAAEETRSVGAVRRVSPLFLQARVPLSPPVRGGGSAGQDIPAGYRAGRDHKGEATVEVDCAPDGPCLVGGECARIVSRPQGPERLGGNGALL